MGQYHKALTKEIEAYHAALPGRPTIQTLYFGGGTPSTYPEDLLLDMFGTLNRVSLFDSGIEITLEVNPGTVTKEKIKLWRQLGINRLSIGVQSLKDSALQKLNRLQTTQDVYEVVYAAEGIFENVSMDLILGLPEVSAAEWRAQLKKMVRWPITHLSIYFLMVHEFTPLYYQVQKKEVHLPVDEQTVELYHWTIDFLAAHGFTQYEISSFAREGFQSKHNRAYWQRQPYKGFGVGAWSFDGECRYRAHKSLMRYMQGIEQGQNVVGFSEALGPEQVALEELMLGLRQTKGLPIAYLLERIAHKKRDEVIAQIEAYAQQGMLRKHKDMVRLTPAGLAVEQEVISQLVS